MTGEDDKAIFSIPGNTVCITDLNELIVSICIIISIPSLLLENFVNPVKIVMPAKKSCFNVLYLF